MSAHAFAEHYVTTEMTGDPEQIVAMYSPTGTLESNGTSVTGREALLAHYTAFLEPMKSISLTLGRAVGDDGTVAFEWFGETEVATGGVVRSCGCDYVSLDLNGLISLNRVHISYITSGA